MNVKELKNFLEGFPDEMEIITRMYSDYQNLEKEAFSVVSAVDKIGYIMRSQPTMSDENKSKDLDR